MEERGGEKGREGEGRAKKGEGRRKERRNQMKDQKTETFQTSQQVEDNGTVCISYFVLHNNAKQKLTITVNLYISCRFCGSGIQDRASWAALTQGSFMRL